MRVLFSLTTELSGHDRVSHSHYITKNRCRYRFMVGLQQKQKKRNGERGPFSVCKDQNPSGKQKIKNKNLKLLYQILFRTKRKQKSRFLVLLLVLQGPLAELEKANLIPSRVTFEDWQCETPLPKTGISRREEGSYVLLV